MQHLGTIGIRTAQGLHYQRSGGLAERDRTLLGDVATAEVDLGGERRLASRMVRNHHPPAASVTDSP